ncbi:MAG: SDR family oxidoreductase [Bacteroidota bacterium]|nr:SDR family oxidoreductase [Bacteroidota bacterium]
MNTHFDLTGKIILVTGASSGIGSQVCISASEMGAKIIATGRNEDRLKQTVSKLTGDGHVYLKADLSNFKEITELVKNIPNINGIVHSTGMVRFIPLRMVTEDNLNEIQKINYNIPVLLNQQLLKNKKFYKGSSIVFITSIMALVGAKGNGMYSGTKGALVAASKVLALETAHQKIRVNCVAPGIVKSPMKDFVKEAFSNEYLSKHEQEYPLGFGEPEDIANGVVFLLSNASKWITGTTIVLDGGFTCR